LDVQVVGQVNLANIVERAQFNASLFIQAQLQKSLTLPTPAQFGIGAGGQFNFVIVKDKVMITWQAVPFGNFEKDAGSGALKVKWGFQVVQAVTLQAAIF
jgi:hypothetical protein